MDGFDFLQLFLGNSKEVRLMKKLKMFDKAAKKVKKERTKRKLERKEF